MGGDLVLVERAGLPAVVRPLAAPSPVEGPSSVQGEPSAGARSRPEWEGTLPKALRPNAVQLYLVAGVSSSPPLVDVWA